MQIIRHRVNLSSDLSQLDPSWGVEVDVRSDPNGKNGIYLSHDPFTPGESLDSWLVNYQSLRFTGSLILNTKEDSLEKILLEKMEAARIKNFFFLDTSFPTLVKWCQTEHRDKFSARLSSFEPIEQVLKLNTGWVWIDCFFGILMPLEELAKIPSNRKTCLVSPELQLAGSNLISDFSTQIRKLKIPIHSVCTKLPSDWIKSNVE